MTTSRRYSVNDWILWAEEREQPPTIEPIRPTTRQLASRQARRDISRDNRKRGAVTR